MKLKQFQRILKKEKIDFALFFNLDPIKSDSNLFYFSGYKGIGALIVSPKKAFLLVPKMEYEKAKKSRIKKVYLFEKKLFEGVLEKTRKNKIKKRKIALDKAVVTLKEYSAFKKSFKKSKIVDVSKICSKLRETKTKEEIKIIKKVCEITDKILINCLNNFKKFKNENDVVAFLEQETRKQGCCFAFPPIIASGTNSSQPHYETGNKLKKGFCVIDFGIRYKGYCSDVTRTIYIGKPSKKEISLYNLLLNIQKETIKKLKEEKNISKIIKFVKNSLGKYNKNFIHGLGHGIGIDLHELPNLKEKGRLKENSIFTIEPGIYLPNKFGIRIEDDILLGKNKLIILTKTTKDLLVI